MITQLHTRIYRKSLFHCIGLLLSFIIMLQNTSAQSFSPGNIAVFVATSSSANNTTGSVVELNTTTAGQGAMSTHVIDGTILRFSGSATSTCYMANSNDGSLLCFTGANSSNTSSNVNTLNPRGVGTFNSTGSFNLQTTYTGVSGNQTRSATSLNNSTWYIGDQGGLYSNGTTTPSPSGNFRGVKSFGGIVYVSSASGTASVIQVSTISAPTGGTVSGLPGLTNNANLQDFYLVSSGSNGSTYDILYTISATTNTAGTINKYSLVSGTWVANGSYATTFGGFGLAAKKNGTGADLFLSTGLGALAANSVFKLTDAAGYNAAIAITTANNINLYTTSAGTTIKGVAFAPLPPPLPTVNLSVSTNNASEAGQTVVTVTATASSPVSGNQTVSLGVSGAGITSADYTLSNSAITILNGATTGSVTFTIIDDAEVEGSETATLTISNPSPGITLGTPVSQSIVIDDNDIAPTVNLIVSTNSGSEAAKTVVTVTATASAAVSGDQSVSLGVSGTGITAGDYSVSNTVITIPNGSASGSVSFTIADDALAEGSETAILTISNPSSGITLGATTTQNITITDNDIDPIRITEYMYSGANGEFIEFTNTGSTAVDMSGWSYDDDSRVAGTVSLSAFGVVQPGESVILTENTISAFRTAWGLCNGIKIIGGLSTNLGRDDEINLFDASNGLVDRLTYGDDITFPGTIRAQNKTGWVNAAGLGNNNINHWTLSSVNDSEGSFTSAGGDIGSPGKSTRATVVYNPCTVVAGAPTIVIDVDSTTNYLDGGISSSPLSPYGISGVISDPTDPARIYGIDFIIGDDVTPAGSLTVTVSSSNTAVVPNTNITLTGNGASRNLRITPAAVGYSNITVTVNDGTYNTSYIINYAASAASATPATTFWHTEMSDASDAIALDDNYFLSGDDELNVLNVYARSASGLPFVSYNYTSNLALPDPAKPEVDVEAATRSTTFPDRIYWLGSMSNGKAPFDNKPNRDRIFATDVTGTGAATAFTFIGYDSLRASLIAWGDAHGYNFTASAAAGVDSKLPNGFAAEGMVFGPDNSTLYIGLRAPLVPTASRIKAVIAPILNFETWFNGGMPSGNPTFGAPIELDLGLRGIRDIIRLSNGNYIIVAGDPGSALTSALYKWTGNASNVPVLVNSSANGVLNMEGAMQMNTGGQLSLSQLQVITDKGGDILYNDGVEAKDFSDLNLRKFRSDILTGMDLSICTTTTGDTFAIVKNSFTWYDSTYTISGNYTHTFINGNAGGCDSVLTLHLTIDTTNTPPMITITYPGYGYSFNAGTDVTVQVQATDADGSVAKVELFVNGVKLAEDTTAPYTFTGMQVEAGIYKLTARATDNKGATSVTDTTTIVFTACTGSGSITAEGYINIPGALVSDLTSSPKYPNSPDVTATLNKFEYGPNFGDNYGGRVRGYICAPVTGNYTFYIAGDEQDGLWLSTDENPANKVLIAYNQTRVNARAWYTLATQKSAPIHLVKGVRYYIETLHKESTGNDHLAVAWQIPGGGFEGPIPGSRLSPIGTSFPGIANHNFEVEMEVALNKSLKIMATPNPSSDYFTITTRSTVDQPLGLIVTDAAGRTVERRMNVTPNGTIQIGNKLPAGIYFVEVVQGVQKQRLKLVKQ